MPFDASEFRRVLGTFVTGVTVVTTLDATGRPHGVTASSFNSVSLDPPLVLWSQSVAAGSYPVFRDAAHFAVNILAEDQIALSDQFAKPGGNKFEGVLTHEGIRGLPLLDGCSAYLQCTKVAAYPGGDHTVFLGRVERIEKSGKKALVFGEGRYLVARPGDLVTYPSSTVVGRSDEAEAIRLATPVAQRLARELGASVAIATWGNHGPTVVRWEEAGENDSLHLRAGYVLSIFATATGRVFVANLPRESTQSFIDAEAHQVAHNQHTELGVVISRLEQEIEKVRSNGFATLTKWPTGATAQTSENTVVSAPVLDRSGSAVLALTAVSGSSRRDLQWTTTAAHRLKADAMSLSTLISRR